MNRSKQFPAIASLTFACALAGGASATDPAPAKPTSYTNVIEEDFGTVMARMKSQKAQIEQRHRRSSPSCDLGNRAASGVTMSRGKPVQEGGIEAQSRPSWTPAAAMTSGRDQGAW